MPGNNQRLLEGEVMDVDDGASEAARLRDDLRRVTAERDTLRGEIIRLRQRVNQIDGPAAQLRQTLEPLYNALRAIMGDIEVIDPQAATTAAPQAGAAVPDSRTSAVWESWKQKLGGQCAKVIDVLLTHGEMNTTQLGIAVGTRRQNVPGLIYKLNQAGLINKNGGRFSLKAL